MSKSGSIGGNDKINEKDILTRRARGRGVKLEIKEK